ncbi:MAG: NepR family anti-sigma factor [Sphingorhabdus sp.]
MVTDLQGLGVLEPKMVQKGKPLPPAAIGSKPFDAHSDPIAIALKRLHEEVESEEIPDEFLKLLAAIDRKISDRENDA